MFQTEDKGVFPSLIFLAVSLLVFGFYWRTRRFFKLAARIPNVKGKTFFGFFGFFGFVGKSIDGIFEEFLTYFREGPEIFKFFVLHHMCVGVSRPEDMELIMTNAMTLNKANFVTEFIKPYLGDGLFSATEDVWKSHRKLINPVFNQKSLNSFMPIFAEKCEIMIDVIGKQVGQPEFDIFGIMSRCTLDIVYGTAMGLNLDAQLSEDRYAKLLDKTMELATRRIFNPFLHSQWIFESVPSGKLFYRLIEQLNTYSSKVIAEKKLAYEQILEGGYYEEKDKNGVKYFIDHLLELSHSDQKFTEKEIQEEVNTFIAAGSDTTATTMSFCCMVLGMYPEYQQKVYEEAIEVLGEDRFATKDDLPKLRFLEMFIKETMRLFPVGPFMVRTASTDVKIDEFVIPKDTVIFLSVMHLHTNPKYWKDPLTFNPYRFSPEELELRHPYSYLPFSGGPRNCIGQRFAMMAMKTILSKIVTKFKIKTGYGNIEDVKVKINLLMRPANGYKVTLEHRE